MQRAEIIHGECLSAMGFVLPDRFDSIVTDPPYGLSFMGRAWDHGVPGTPFWTEALRVAKPGAYLAAFGGTRTFHRLACAIEDAGWELRDTLMWVYGSGFPKSHNGEWGGTALKPAWEPIILARKPLVGTVEANWREHGTGAMNIDACRVGDSGARNNGSRAGQGNAFGYFAGTEPIDYGKGRWPANLVRGARMGWPTPVPRIGHRVKAGVASDVMRTSLPRVMADQAVPRASLMSLANKRKFRVLRILPKIF